MLAASVDTYKYMSCEEFKRSEEPQHLELHRASQGGRKAGASFYLVPPSRPESLVVLSPFLFAFHCSYCSQTLLVSASLPEPRVNFPMTSPLDNLHSHHRSQALERAMIIADAERAVATTYPNATSNTTTVVRPNYVRNAANDNLPLVDQHGRPVTVERLLATKPLRSDLASRKGPGGRTLTYISGEAVSRSLNEIFGHAGWSLDIKSATQTQASKDQNGKWTVTYLAHVRITLTSGAYKEDMGEGDAVDKSLPTAVANAMKSSITDGLKRAARHFGDKLGNSLYAGDFQLHKAPKTIFEALSQYETESLSKLGAANVHIHNAGKLSDVKTPSHHAPANQVASEPSRPRNVYQMNHVRNLQQSTSMVTTTAAYAPSYVPPVGTDNRAAGHQGNVGRISAVSNAAPQQIQRPVLADNSVTNNSPPLTSAQSLQNRFHGGNPPNAPPGQVPPYGKRGGGGGDMPPAEAVKRPRHNPYV